MYKKYRETCFFVVILRKSLYNVCRCPGRKSIMKNQRNEPEQKQWDRHAAVIMAFRGMN